jgi:hypothetical protein
VFRELEPVKGPITAPFSKPVESGFIASANSNRQSHSSQKPVARALFLDELVRQ